MTALPIIRPGRLGAAVAERILARARTEEPTYGFVGALLGDDPPPLDLDVERTLGHGPDAFARAVAHLRSFGPQRSVATVWPDDATADPGADLIVALGLGPITVIAIDRVVAVVDEPRRWGFAYGTLPGHIEVGEEAFLVERRPDDTVVARITAHAHVALPGRAVLQRILLPIQRRYAERYLDALAEATSADGAQGRGEYGSDVAPSDDTDATQTAPDAPDERPILVVDFGAQYAQLIARRVREAHVYSEIVPASLTAQQYADRDPAGIIFSGGPASVHVEGAPSIDPGIYDLGIPILGICYGAQLVALQLGGTVEATGRSEYGRTPLDVTHPDAVVFGGGQPSHQQVWMSHRDSIQVAPEGFTVTASSPDAPVAAMEDVVRRIHAVQFHPEVVHTPHGQQILERWIYEVTGSAPDWTMTSVIESGVEAVRQQVGGARVICALSGGVDSAVAAALVHKAIGPQLTCVFVDHGLMRAGEGEQVVETFRRHQGIELIHVQAQDRFFAKLEGVTDPEDKRKAIGEEFIRVFEETSGGIEDARFLVQGTLYPDVIESGGGEGASTIKSHHNVGGLPEDMQFDLVEPLRSLFKDEVRALGTELGLPDEIVWRQPFPGPGLGVRIIGEVTPERVALLQRADTIVREEIRAAGLEREIWQAFAVLPDIRSVGVMGDERTYGHPIIIRAVTSEDAMTADWARLPHELLERMSSRIINEVDGVNRVAYDITSKPPGTIEWE